MLNKQPSYQKEKAWLERITRHGCVVTGGEYNLQRHHVLGREAKKNKLYIGRWFAIPLLFCLHDISRGDERLNVTHHKNAFTDQFGLQSELFKQMCEAIRLEDGALPFDDEILIAIMDTKA